MFLKTNYKFVNILDGSVIFSNFAELNDIKNAQAFSYNLQPFQQIH